MLLRLYVIASIVAAGCPVAAVADTTTESTRPIRLVVPTAAGGGTDTLARILSPKLSDATGQQWIIDNRAGAGGNVGTELVVRALPDGHTVLLAFNTILTVNSSLYDLSFNMQRDLQPVTMLDSAQFLLLLNPTVQANSVKDLIALAKAQPGAINYASSGIGGPAHLAAELFMKRTGTRMTHVAYKGGSPSVAAVVSGESQVLFGSVTESLGNVKSGRLKAIANTSATRSKVLPDVPTIAESGVPGFDFTKWDALLVPASTPALVVKRLHEAALKALGNSEVQQAMARQGLEVKTSTPLELAGRVKAESEIWAGVVKDARIRAD
jgi:tripartite-type tricarboxylate transporter receptor subunit TctC